MTIIVALLFPIGCLLMLLLMDRLEETLEESDPVAEPAPVKAEAPRHRAAA